MSKVQQLQLLQQNYQQVLMQKQQVQNQIVEFESALSELKDTDKSYRIIGKIMVATSTEKLTKELEEKKETAFVRLDKLKKQEDSLQTQMKKIQEEVMSELKKEDDN